MVKKSPDNAGDVGGMGSMPGSEKSPGEGQLFLPGEPHGQRSLASHGPWGRKESDIAKAIKHTCTGSIYT